MIKFFSGVVVGAVSAWLVITHPTETKQVVQSGVNAASNAVSSAATAGQKFASDKLNSK